MRRDSTQGVNARIGPGAWCGHYIRSALWLSLFCILRLAFASAKPVQSSSSRWINMRLVFWGDGLLLLLLLVLFVVSGAHDVSPPNTAVEASRMARSCPVCQVSTVEDGRDGWEALVSCWTRSISGLTIPPALYDTVISMQGMRLCPCRLRTRALKSLRADSHYQLPGADCLPGVPRPII
jgi:hypothetical protein